MALNALKYGTHSRPQNLAETLADLGEDPCEFQCFLAGLRVALDPADAVERMLAEDIATLAWKRRRLDRAQTGLQLRNLELLHLARHRQALQVGRQSADVSQAEVIKTGLRRSARSPAKFGEILSYLEMLSEAVNKTDFSQDAEPIFTAPYGEEPTLRGAEIIHLYRRFQGAEQAVSGSEGEKEEQALLAALKVALQEETRDVAEEYALYLQENVHVSPVLRNATLAPSNPEWRAMIRQEYALDRMMERKLKLLMKMQTIRKAREQASVSAEGAGAKKKNSFLRKQS